MIEIECNDTFNSRCTNIQGEINTGVFHFFSLLEEYRKLAFEAKAESILYKKELDKCQLACGKLRAHIAKIDKENRLKKY